MHKCNLQASDLVVQYGLAYFIETTAANYGSCHLAFAT